MTNSTTESTTLVWVHGDCLSPYNPASVAYPNAPAVFVFDPPVLDEYAITLKRIAFMYESLLEIPHIDIRLGDVVVQLQAAAQEYGCTRIATTATIAPHFYELVKRLQSQISIKVLEPEPFFVPNQRLDLRRFSRYWQDASRFVLNSDET